MRTTFLVWGPANGFHGFYFRVFGFGLSIQRDMRVLFGERYGYRRVLRVGRWAFMWLKRSGLPSIAAGAAVQESGGVVGHPPAGKTVTQSPEAEEGKP